MVLISWAIKAPFTITRGDQRFRSPTSCLLADYDSADSVVTIQHDVLKSKTRGSSNKFLNPCLAATTIIFRNLWFDYHDVYVGGGVNLLIWPWIMRKSILSTDLAFQPYVSLKLLLWRICFIIQHVMYETRGIVDIVCLCFLSIYDAPYLKNALNSVPF